MPSISRDVGTRDRWDFRMPCGVGDSLRRLGLLFLDGGGLRFGILGVSLHSVLPKVSLRNAERHTR